MFNAHTFPGQLTVARSLFEAAGFAMTGTTPYRLGKQSPAIGAVDAVIFKAGSKDVLGKPRARGGRAELGAYAYWCGR